MSLLKKHFGCPKKVDGMEGTEGTGAGIDVSKTQYINV